MATNVINELDKQLASLSELKPPGASRGKMTSITQLCVSNIQAEINIVQSLYRALKKAPATHKLGCIYAIDSVVRRWIELAKAQGQELITERRGEPGTFPAAVKRVTELMPALWDDCVKSMPPDQKEKAEGMIKIWEKGNTFPPKMLAEFREKLNGVGSQQTAHTNGAPATQNGANKPTGQKFTAPTPTRPLSTPTGYPPQRLYEQGLMPTNLQAQQSNGVPVSASQPAQQAAPQTQPAIAANQSDVNSILAALANAAVNTPQKPTSFPAPQQNGPPQLPANIAALFGQQNGLASLLGQAQQPQQTQQPAYSYQPQQAAVFPPAQPQTTPNFQPYPPFQGYVPQPPPSVPQHFAQAPPPQQAPPQQQVDPLAAVRHLFPQNILNDQPKLLEALSVLADLQKEGIPMEEWGPVIQAFDSQYQAPTQHGYDAYGRGGARSRSPQRDGGRRRASPVYGTYQDMTANKPAEDDRMAHGGSQRRYRERSPMRDALAPMQMTNNLAMNGNPMQPKYIGFDNTLPNNNIKVLSRTLFVGGANGSQQEIQDLFERFGRVQTCIANRDKRHAFVKMATRSAAASAKEGMEKMQIANDRDVMNIARQTKWGVGFGPRECCNYAKGESIIPIHKLTEADMKWLLTAEYGGTGGQKVEGGMVLEEPDIEIGAGVSSKAMSKRVGPDTGPTYGAKRGREDNSGQRKDRDKAKKGNDAGYGGYSGVSGGMAQQHMPMEAYGYPRPEPVAVATPPAVPGFGFTLPGQPTYR